MIIGLYLILVPVLELGMRINYTPDTQYLNWTTTFPGFTVCEEPNTKSALPELLTPLSYDHRRYLTDLLYTRSNCSNTHCEPSGKIIPCDVPWKDIVERRARDPVCCVGPAVLAFRLLSDAEISIHSSEELSTNKLDAKLKQVVRTYSENHVDWFFSAVETDNDQLLEREYINARGCRFLNEIPDKPLHTYPVIAIAVPKECRCVRSVKTKQKDKKINSLISSQGDKNVKLRQLTDNTTELEDTKF